MGKPFYTVGHSRRSIAEFVDLLQAAQVALVVDVRKMPRSRGNPQFNADSLPPSLAPFQIAYAHIPALGGLRPKQRAVAPEVNAYWSNASFHNYADYAMTEGFHAGLAELRARGHGRTCTVMCSEAVWWQCHRRIIADYLIAAGEEVFHIMAPGRIDQARPTPGAQPHGHGLLTYPAYPAADAEAPAAR